MGVVGAFEYLLLTSERERREREEERKMRRGNAGCGAAGPAAKMHFKGP